MFQRCGTRIIRACAIPDAGWPIKYISLLPEQKTLGECRECWYWIQHGRSRQSGPGARVLESATTLTNSTLCVHGGSQPYPYLCESTRFLEYTRVRQFGTRMSARSHGVVTGARGVGHRLPWQPEGKPFHPAGGISRKSKPSSQKTLRCILHPCQP